MIDVEYRRDGRTFLCQDGYFSMSDEHFEMWAETYNIPAPVLCAFMKELQERIEVRNGIIRTKASQATLYLQGCLRRAQQDSRRNRFAELAAHLGAMEKALQQAENHPDQPDVQNAGSALAPGAPAQACPAVNGAAAASASGGPIFYPPANLAQQDPLTPTEYQANQQAMRKMFECAYGLRDQIVAKDIWASFNQNSLEASNE